MKSDAPKVPKQAETKRGGEINPKNYTISINFLTVNIDALKLYESIVLKNFDALKLYESIGLKK